MEEMISVYLCTRGNMHVPTHARACLKTKFCVIPALVCSSRETSGSCLPHPASSLSSVDGEHLVSVTGIPGNE